MTRKPKGGWTREELEAGWKEERRLRKNAEEENSALRSTMARLMEAHDGIDNALDDARTALKRGLDEANWAGTRRRAHRKSDSGGGT